MLYLALNRLNQMDALLMNSVSQLGASQRPALGCVDDDLVNYCNYNNVLLVLGNIYWTRGLSSCTCEFANCKWSCVDFGDGAKVNYCVVVNCMS